jgi:hypothetical protein
LRLVPDNQKDTEFLALPLGIPIDYFEPEFFNRLQPHLRHHIAVQKVAFLPDVGRSFTHDPDERLDDNLFMEKYGKTILAKYDLDGLDSLAAEEEWDMDGEAVESSDDDMEDVDDTNVSLSRLQLAAHLSVEHF